MSRFQQKYIYTRSKNGLMQWEFVLLPAFNGLSFVSHVLKRVSFVLAFATFSLFVVSCSLAQDFAACQSSIPVAELACLFVLSSPCRMLAPFRQ